MTCMFAYPKQTELNRTVPKAKIYLHAQPGPKLTNLFVAQVDQILWRHKLAPETLNLPERAGISEIQVFELTLRTQNVDTGILHTIDKAIPFPLLFELVHDGAVRFACSYKRPSESDASKWVIEGMFMTAPQPVTATRLPLPIALDLAALYEQIVRSHIGLLPRKDESIAEQVARLNALHAKQRACRQLLAHLAHEKQFNRKVELNEQLRELTAEIAALQR